MTNDSNPQEWKECKLSEVARLVKDTYKPKTGDHLPYIGLEHIQEQGLRLLSVGDSDSVTSQKFRFKCNDVLFGKLRPYFRKVVKPSFSGVCSTDIWVVRAVEDNDQDFIFYFFANQELVDTANSGDSGTRMPRADWHFVKDTIWQFPPLPEQRAIASVLSSLDNKIDLLHRQNKTLEGMAEALWQKMFVEDADSDWKRGKLGDYGQIICGKTPSKKVAEYFGGHIPFIKIPDMHGNVFIFETEDSLTETGVKSQQSKTIPAKSICVSCIATVGLVCMNAVDSQTNQQINTIIPNNEFQRYFLFLVMRNMTDDLLARASGGTATDNLNTGDFSRIEISKPPENDIQKFDDLVRAHFEKIYANQIQIRTLSRLRDTLLPKLMSGEVRVKEN